MVHPMTKIGKELKLKVMTGYAPKHSNHYFFFKGALVS
ncbi:hypothetical protein JCM19239_3392 [Vibrio variabilis]|uniref:Uncharacterized protein n=1 Tax=Vibrio variabilis TaxID=990271 RepID=A0ABQ0JHC6_9VIBR|nr:hypothetical protein JCM19239_3392 [Vibrio variabilis]